MRFGRDAIGVGMFAGQFGVRVFAIQVGIGVRGRDGSGPVLPLSGCSQGDLGAAREWRNRQTRTVQVRVPARAWGFNSPLAHRGVIVELPKPCLWNACSGRVRSGRSAFVGGQRAQTSEPAQFLGCSTALLARILALPCLALPWVVSH